MKTSVILIVLMVMNTSMLISKPLSTYIEHVDVRLFIGVEIIIMLMLFLNNIFKDVRNAYDVEF